MPYYQCDLIRVDEDGDVKVAVGDCRFLVSSSKMSALSSKFHEIFSPPGEIASKEILLLEDPAAFHIICQSAHGVFIPQATITTDNLVKLAAAVRRYDIPMSSPLCAVVNFCFIIQSFQPGRVSTTKLLKLLQVAKSLDPHKLKQLLLDVFHHSGLRCEALTHVDEDKDCALLLASVLLNIAGTRAQVASSLIGPSDTGKYELVLAKEVRDIGIWVVKHHPSLHELGLRLDKFQNSEKPSRHDIIKSAREIIALATVDITQFISDGIGEDLESEIERRNREASESDAYEEMGIEQLKVEEAARELAEIPQVDKVSSAQHLSDEKFGSFSADFEGFDDEDYVEDYFHFDMDLSPSRPHVFMSKTI